MRDEYEAMVLGGFEVEDVDYIIFGTGKVGDIFYNKIFESIGDRVLCFINEQQDIKDYRNKPVYKCKEIPQEYRDNGNVKFITATMGRIAFFSEKIREIGIPQSRIINPSKIFSRIAFLQDERPLKRIILYPAITDGKILDEKICTFENITVPNHDEDVEFVFLSDIEYNKKLRQDFKIIRINDLANKEYDSYWIWDSSRVNDEFLKDKDRKVCCDESFMFWSEGKMHLELNNKISLHSHDKLYKKNYARMCDDLSIYQYAVVCGTGPSIYNMDDKTKTIVSRGLKIVCNSFCMTKCNIVPNIYVFQEPGYALFKNKKILRELMKYVIDNKIYLVVNQMWGETLIQLFPDVKDYIIALNEQEDMCFPSKTALNYKFYENVVPGFCIPIASGLKDKTYIIGCDGLNKKSGWSHANGTEDKEDGHDSDKEGHSFFIMNNIKSLTDYSDRVDDIWKEVLEYGENNNKEYISLTESSYTELKKRYINF
ncbi:MAG: hypothetical protein E7259_07350 [Lachnospiraceae bacterium]|nr:hypothetical protein [Lachnospiraceae bacterium]